MHLASVLDLVQSLVHLFGSSVDVVTTSHLAAAKLGNGATQKRSPVQFLSIVRVTQAKFPGNPMVADRRQCTELLEIVLGLPRKPPRDTFLTPSRIAPSWATILPMSSRTKQVSEFSRRSEGVSRGCVTAPTPSAQMKFKTSRPVSDPGHNFAFVLVKILFQKISWPAKMHDNHCRGRFFEET